jgi:L-ribulose-5-phosphate 4-epimerase
MRSHPISTLREEICELNRSLPKHGLVVMHSGNASGFDPETGRVLIKPSGMDYDKITPDNLVEVDLISGRVLGSTLRPSVDLVHHLYLYRNLPGIRSVIHTHSNYATAFAACLEPIPLCLTAIADEFGDSIPCTPYVSNVGDAIGQAIMEHRNLSPAILLGNHGVFAWGGSPAAALKAAVMVEDVAKTLILARQVGVPQELPQGEAKVWYFRYQNRYGQAKAA